MPPPFAWRPHEPPDQLVVLDARRRLDAAGGVDRPGPRRARRPRPRCRDRASRPAAPARARRPPAASGRAASRRRAATRAPGRAAPARPPGSVVGAAPRKPRIMPPVPRRTVRTPGPGRSRRSGRPARARRTPPPCARRPAPARPARAARSSVTPRGLSATHTKPTRSAPAATAASTSCSRVSPQILTSTAHRRAPPPARPAAPGSRISDGADQHRVGAGVARGLDVRPRGDARLGDPDDVRRAGPRAAPAGASRSTSSVSRSRALTPIMRGPRATARSTSAASLRLDQHVHAQQRRPSGSAAAPRRR